MTDATDVTDALQVAQVAALLADADVTNLVGDHVFDPLSAENADYPLIEVGDDQELDDSNTCMTRSEVFSTIHVWAAGPDGRRQAKKIGGAVKAVLRDNKLNLDGYTVTTVKFNSARYFTDTDETLGALVAHGVLVFQYMISPNA